MADLLVIPTCGGTCNIQRDHIQITDIDQQGFLTGCDVSFMMVISTLQTPDQTENIDNRLNLIHGTTRVRNGFEFQPGSWNGKKSVLSTYGIGVPTVIQKITDSPQHWLVFQFVIQNSKSEISVNLDQN